MYYEVEGQEIHPEDHKNSEFRALEYAIRLACEYASSRKVPIIRVDDNGQRRQIKYTVPPQPVKERKGYYYPKDKK